MADDPPRIVSAEELAASLTARVADVLAAAEQAAAKIRAAADAENAGRALEIRRAAEQDADRVLRRAERDAAVYLEDARRRVDAFADGRARRMGAVSDRLLAHAEALAARAERATRLRDGIDAVVDALAAAAEAIAAEAGRAPIDLSAPAERSAEVTRLTTRPHAVPDLEPAPDRPRADDAGEHVRQIASALPRRPGAPRPVAPTIPPDPPPHPPDDAA